MGNYEISQPNGGPLCTSPFFVSFISKWITFIIALRQHGYQQKFACALYSCKGQNVNIIDIQIFSSENCSHIRMMQTGPWDFDTGQTHDPWSTQPIESDLIGPINQLIYGGWTIKSMMVFLFSESVVSLIQNF